MQGINEEKKCFKCGITTTTAWRRAKGSLVCNACGLYLKYNKAERPKRLYNKEIRPRNRGQRGGYGKAAGRHLRSSQHSYHTRANKNGSAAVPVEEPVEEEPVEEEPVEEEPVEEEPIEEEPVEEPVEDGDIENEVDVHNEVPEMPNEMEGVEEQMEQEDAIGGERDDDVNFDWQPEDDVDRPMDEQENQPINLVSEKDEKRIYYDPSELHAFRVFSMPVFDFASEQFLHLGDCYPLSALFILIGRICTDLPPELVLEGNEHPILEREYQWVKHWSADYKRQLADFSGLGEDEISQWHATRSKWPRENPSTSPQIKKRQVEIFFMGRIPNLLEPKIRQWVNE